MFQGDKQGTGGLVALHEHRIKAAVLRIFGPMSFRKDSTTINGFALGLNYEDNNIINYIFTIILYKNNWFQIV